MLSSAYNVNTLFPEFFKPELKVSKAEEKNKQTSDDGMTLEEFFKQKLNPPEPYDPDTDKAFWEQGVITQWDTLVPEGFLSDFVLYGRSNESPTEFWLWAGVWGISRLLGRDAFLEWGDDKLYANFYIIFVAKAGIFKKSTAVNKIGKVLDNLSKFLPRRIGYEKTHAVMKGKASEAAFYMLGEVAPLVTIDSNDKVDSFYRNANICIQTSELATLLGKEMYKSGITVKLTDWYDCPDYDTEHTRGRGKLEIKNVYCTLFGATTPTGFKESLPPEVAAEGFGSRSTIVYTNTESRRFPMPLKLKNAPDVDELCRRLSWIAANARGSYTLSKEGYKFYVTWYNKWKDALLRKNVPGAMWNRLDIQLLKLAVILRAQEYRQGTVIDLRHITLAALILERTVQSSEALDHVLNESPEVRDIDKMEDYIGDNPGVTRIKLMANLRLTKKDVDPRLKELMDRGRLAIVDEKIPTKNGPKMYRHNLPKPRSHHKYYLMEAVK